MGNLYNICTRAQALTIKIYGSINADIQAATKISIFYIKSVVQKAQKRGFNKTKNYTILNIYLKDIP